MKRHGPILLSVVFLSIAAPAASQAQSAAEIAKRGWQAFTEGHPAEAQPLLAEAVRRDPKRPSYHIALAEVDWRLGDAKGAIHQWETALRLNPADEEVRSKLAQVYQALGRDLDVVRVLEAPNPRDANLARVWRFSRGFSLFRLGRLAAAQREFQPLVSHPDFQAPANFFLGRIAYTQNHFEEALPFFADAVRLGDSPTNKEYSSYTYDYGLTLFKLGRFAEANAQFTLSTERYAREPLAWMMRGRCEEELRNYQGAIAAYEESIKVDPKFELSYYHLARLQQRYGDKQRAEELFKRLGELRQGELSDAQMRAEDAAALRMKAGSSPGPASVPAP